MRHLWIDVSVAGSLAVGRTQNAGSAVMDFLELAYGRSPTAESKAALPSKNSFPFHRATSRFSSGLAASDAALAVSLPPSNEGNARTL